MQVQVVQLNNNDNLRHHWMVVRKVHICDLSQSLVLLKPAHLLWSIISVSILSRHVSRASEQRTHTHMHISHDFEKQSCSQYRVIASLFGWFGNTFFCDVTNSKCIFVSAFVEL